MYYRPTIYEYTNYRDYLKAYYLMRKKQEEGYSYRAMSQQLGFSSPNYFKLIIDQKRHLGRKAIEQVALGLGLKRYEAAYFHSLIHFAKSKNEYERNLHFNDMTQIRSGRVVTKIEESHYAYFEHWYNCVIRELVVGLRASSINYAELAQRVVPAIHHAQAKHAVLLLLKLGFIYEDDCGVLQTSSPVLNTANESFSYTLKQFHRDMIHHGAESIDRFPRTEREISSVTMRVSEQGLSRIKQRIQEFREELLLIVAEDQNADRITQFNMQFFPMSTTPDKEPSHD